MDKWIEWVLDFWECVTCSECSEQQRGSHDEVMFVQIMTCGDLSKLRIICRGCMNKIEENKSHKKVNNG